MTVEPEIEITILPECARLEDCASDAATKLMIVPANVESAGPPVFASTLPTFVKLAKKHDLAVTIYGDGVPQLIEQRSIEWFAPAILISSLFYTESPHTVSIALSMISNYLTTLFPLSSNAPGVRLDVYYQHRGDKVTTKLHYRGPVGGLSKIEDAVRAVASGKKP